jgi:hypothetical protein
VRSFIGYESSLLRFNFSLSGGDGFQIGATEPEASRQYFNLLQWPASNHSSEGRAAYAKQLCGSRHSHEQRAKARNGNWLFLNARHKNAVNSLHLFR